MRKEIYISTKKKETRIAVLEDGQLVELFFENPEQERMVGDIYLGKVARVLPGIKAAFINIGHKQDAFLHFADIDKASIDEFSDLLGDDTSIDEMSEVEAKSEPVEARLQPIETSATGQGVTEAYTPRKSHLLKKGQPILVQVIKEPLGRKGARVTTRITLPGRFLVLMPFMENKIGISRKISNQKERRRLRNIIRALLPDGYGVIVRTAAEGKDTKTIRGELEQLITTWEKIEKMLAVEKPPALLYKDLGVTSSVMRDLLTKDVERVVVDSKSLYREIVAYARWAAPDIVDKIELDETEDIFEKYGINREIENSLGRKVYLRGGSYILIEQTETMTVIDVNTGKYAPRKDQEQVSLRINLDAAREIVRQLRLRDIGGLIVVDFIDLEDEKSKKRLLDELLKEFKKDRAKVTVLPMSEFGLVQITRQRVRPSVFEKFSEPCPTCAGTGVIFLRDLIFRKIERWLTKFKAISSERNLIFKLHPTLAKFMKTSLAGRIKTIKLMLRYFIKLKVEPDPTLSVEEFRVVSAKTGKELTETSQVQPFQFNPNKQEQKNENFS
ncbi:ribonuclease G [Candidatus Thermokryptus mobilis]|uniref:Ribonuclease G n=1 Tax=Candidatus Thermokryptus mobilis TaxID=1643428 RepID=A0A0S4MSA5_9BACT|nr:Rne/Rng family ribonuclease [Candidatus Thermokryptus mobilis]CUU01625.1 ribonuclease G [Candidatus Thermokryptus mobilis]